MTWWESYYAKDMHSRLSSSEPGVLKSPRGHAPPLHFIKGLISQKPFRSPPPWPYIFLFLMLRHIQWHHPGTPWGHAPPPLFHKNPNISETFRIPIPKPYIFFFLMLRHPVTLTGDPPGGMTHLLHFIYISETNQIPTPKPYIFWFHMLRCIQWHQPGSPWGHTTIPSLYKRPMNTGRGLCIALQYYCILFVVRIALLHIRC